MADDRGTTQAAFHLMDNTGEETDVDVDDFFDTSHSLQASNAHHTGSSRNYDLSSERFLFDGDDEDVIVSPSGPTSPYVNRRVHHLPHGAAINTEPLLPNYLLQDDQWSDDHPLALPLARLTQEQYARRLRRPELSGLNYLNLCTLLVHLTVSIIFGSGVIERALNNSGNDDNHHYSWLPSTWTVTTLPEYETLLTPSQWAGDYLWIPVLALEGIFVLVQLLPKVRSRPEVVTDVGYSWFYVGMLQSLSTLFFCLKWIIPAYIAVAGTVACLSWMLYYRQHPLQSTTASPRKWEYWIFRFPFAVHLGWLLPLLASRGSMIFRYYCGNHHVGLQLAADIVAMALLLPCAGIYVVRGSSGPRNLVVPILILWAYLGIACRLTAHPPDVLVEAYGLDIVVAVRDAAWSFTGAVGLLVIPRIVIWVAREFLTIHVVELAGDDDDDADGDVIDDLLLRPANTRESLESAVSGMTEF